MQKNNDSHQSTYHQDAMNDRLFSEFLDNSFYKPLAHRARLKFKRVKNRELQTAGIDVILYYQGNEYNIDEKTAMHWANLNLNTFAFEIESYSERQDAVLTGWLFKDGQKTDLYLLSWPNIMADSKRDDRPIKRLESSKDFLPFEAMLINREKLTNKLADEGYTKDTLTENVKTLKAEYAKSGTTITQLTKDLKLQYSPKYAEHPVNIVIKKRWLRDTAEAAFLISKDGYGILTR